MLVHDGWAKWGETACGEKVPKGLAGRWVVEWVKTEESRNRSLDRVTERMKV